MAQGFDDLPAWEGAEAANIQTTDAEVYAGVEKALRKYFGKRGDRVVQDNLTCVKRGYGDMKEVPPAVMAE